MRLYVPLLEYTQDAITKFDLFSIYNSRKNKPPRGKIPVEASLWASSESFGT
jgi:hypothetical protein